MAGYTAAGSSRVPGIFWTHCRSGGNTAAAPPAGRSPTCTWHGKPACHSHPVGSCTWAMKSPAISKPHLSLPPTPLPWTAFALRTPCALVHVLDTNAVWAVAEAGAEDLLAQVVTDAWRLSATAGAIPSGVASDPGEPLFRVTEEDPARYLARVLRAKEYIRAGDIYQANLSRPWRVQPVAAPGSTAYAEALDTAMLYERPAGAQSGAVRRAAAMGRRERAQFIPRAAAARQRP